MEFLKEILGDELYSQIAEKLKGSDIKLADLSKGGYIGAEKFKTLETDRDSLKTQLDEANKQIDSFKGMDIEGIKKAADDWKATAKKAQEDADAKISAMQFDYDLERMLVNAKAKDPKVVSPLLKRDMLKRTDDGIAGLKEQLEAITKSHGYLFDIEEPKQDPAPQNQLPSGAKLFQPDGQQSTAKDTFNFGFTPIKPIPKKE